jgi:hypothetical protein
MQQVGVGAQCVGPGCGAGVPRWPPAGAAGGSSYTIQITAAPGSDGQAIAWSRQTIETIEREQASRRGSRLSD